MSATNFARQSVLEVCYHFPLALGHVDIDDALAVWVRLEREAGPLMQGKIIRSITLPPNGTVQVIAAGERMLFVLDAEEGVSVFRNEELPSEAEYMQAMGRGLMHGGPAPTDRVLYNPGERSIRLDAGPISLPFLPEMLQNIIDRAETQSRLSEVAIRRARSFPRDPDDGLPQTRILTNPNRLRALTLFLYHADKHEVVRCKLSRIERLVVGAQQADKAHIATMRAAIDQQLMAVGLLDAQGQVPAEAQQRYSWQRSFRLPTPHVLVKACPLENITDSAIFGPVKIDLLPRAA